MQLRSATIAEVSLVDRVGSRVNESRGKKQPPLGSLKANETPLSFISRSVKSLIDRHWRRYKSPTTLNAARIYLRKGGARKRNGPDRPRGRAESYFSVASRWTLFARKMPGSPSTPRHTILYGSSVCFCSIRGQSRNARAARVIKTFPDLVGRLDVVS